MRLKSLLFAILLLATSYRLFAQQDPMYTQYMNNMQIVNPAYAGSHDAYQAALVYRAQWVGLEGAPETLTGSFSAPIRKYNLGVGFSVLQDKIGPTETTNINLDVSYKIKLSEKRVTLKSVSKRGGKYVVRSKKEMQGTYLSFGVKAGYNMFSINEDMLNPENPNDPTVYGLEPSSEPDFGAGVYFYSSRFYAGFSIPKFFSKATDGETQNGQDVRFNELHYYFTTGAVFDLSSTLKIKPSMLLRMTAGAPPSIDVNALLLAYDKIWFGGGYRIGDGFVAIAQYNLTDHLKVGYSYDLATTGLFYHNNGTHEISINYDFKLKRSDQDCRMYF
ncbi:PorP/SprF family type IX secretion system membrane protein [Aureibacter tunicatorum]|uniref:Type IX secretion system PorP/SprF family membrane protein n=1 Tax=Aureibacter tunicatorum TaxID=866807 RepID=A0AAE3XST5_9BACT|nr:type IX secretion system membrane protein PorP/SprF [Aureibacter tunicatorum]MDR6241231.1 type IX secretion system PorP/SprF family membrane protein [Aureibacter tunicatorum]BDD03491.1 membrane protein [Aureibacter tunicatorum]